jgi:hypothetical protein
MGRQVRFRSVVLENAEIFPKKTPADKAGVFVFSYE